jgi:hypothetical protein
VSRCVGGPGRRAPFVQVAATRLEIRFNSGLTEVGAE